MVGDNNFRCGHNDGGLCCALKNKSDRIELKFTFVHVSFPVIYATLFFLVSVVLSYSISAPGGDAAQTWILFETISLQCCLLDLLFFFYKFCSR